MTCAIRSDDSVTCWGDNRYGQADPPDGTFDTIHVSDRHYACGIRTDGTAVCWGDVYDWHMPRDWDNPPGTYEAIAAGGEYICGLGSDGEVDCGFEQFMLPASRGPFTAIAAGTSHACGLRTDGTIKCWGGSIDALVTGGVIATG